tara:strand:- start:1462 stop:2094 length:633 start_codon:yes stop_codon:yes gene_type:complete
MWKIDKKGTKSSTYILPVLDTQVKFDFLPKIINSYLYNNTKDMNFCVLYVFSAKEDFIKYEEKLLNHVLCTGHQDYGEYVLYTFRLTEEMQRTMNLYLKGMYSHFPESHKNSIEDFLKRRGFANSAKVRGVLDRNSEVRKALEKSLKVRIDPSAELSSPPDISLEIFEDHIKEIIIKPKEGEEIYGNIEKDGEESTIQSEQNNVKSKNSV